MTINTKIRRPASWCFVLPDIAAPVSGVLFKEVGHTSTLAALGIGLAPYMVSVIRYVIFLIGYVPTVICYLRSSQARQDDIRDLIALSANALVSMQTLIPTGSSGSRPPTLAASKPGLRVLESKEAD